MDSAPGDGNLVEAALAGDRAAFGVLIERHRRWVAALAQRMLGDRAEADDIVQEALLRAYLGLRELREPARFGSWLFGIAANLVRMRLRERARWQPLHEARWSGAARETESVELLALLQAALEALPPDQREAVLLRHVEGLSAAEIAARRGESAGAVRVRLHRARSRLREQLAKEVLGMVEVEVHDVLVRVRTDEEEPRPATEDRVVLLREKPGGRLLPIWMRAADGDALAFQLRSELPLRPLTADLAARLLEIAGGRIERVLVNSLREKTFYATITVAAQRRREDVDARPSDAMNLALRVGAPIFVDEEVMVSTAVGAEKLPDELERWRAECDPDEPPGQWRSLSAEILRPLYAPPR